MERPPSGGGVVPILPLDLNIHPKYLRRRGGISYGPSSCFYFKPRFERRGGISFDRRDNNAIYVRMLGDVQMKSKLEYCKDRRSSGVPVSDLKLLDKLASKDYKVRWSSRFLSLHKAHRRRRSMIKLSPQNNSLLDELYIRQAECLLANLENWNVDMFYLDILTCGRPLFHVSMHLFHQYNLIQAFNLESLKLMHTFSLIEEGYHDNNPYHNAVHAADVTQALHCYLQEKDLQDTVPDLEIMTSLVAAMTHDLDHPGVNQAFLIATANHLAALYGNTSVLENHHWRSAMGVLHETGVFNHVTMQEWQKIEWQIKSLILATDITRQQEFLISFRKYLESGEFNYKEDPLQRHFMLQIALKCADISNPCREWSISRRWSERVCDEFFRQGDYESRLQVPVTPMCNRQTTTVAKIQAGFFEFVVSPLFNEWYHFLPTKLSEDMLKNIAVNKNNWQAIIEEEKEKQKQAVKESMPENSGGNSNDEEESDTVEETRLPLTFTHLIDDDETSQTSYGGSRRASCRSLSPLRELRGNPEDWHPEIRRHSMPPVYIHKEITCVTIRRDSLPNTQYLRRRSLPTAMILHSTSMDRRVGKLSPLSMDWGLFKGKSYSMEELLSKPKISNLSPSYEASRLTSGLSMSSELIHTKSSQSGALKYFTMTQSSKNVCSRRGSNHSVGSEFKHGPTISLQDFSTHAFQNPVSNDLKLLAQQVVRDSDVPKQDEDTQDFNCAPSWSSSSMDGDDERGELPVYSEMNFLLPSSSNFGITIGVDGTDLSSSDEASRISKDISSTPLLKPVSPSSLSQGEQLLNPSNLV